MRFFIVDCNGCFCGNQNGYATMRGAQQAARYYSRYLWDLFYMRGDSDTTVYEIKQY